jgi:Mrp family chromosome partitioning ATPase
VEQRATTTDSLVLPTVAARYAGLRERLLVAANGHSLRAIIFSGCEGNEGADQVVREFAETLTTSGLNVLVLEAAVGRDASPSANDVTKLVDLVVKDTLPPPAAGGRGQLTIVAGATATTDKESFYRSAEFASWFDRQRGLYDYVLLAAPPIVRSADAALLGRLCDGVVLVVEAGSTSRRAFSRAREQLERTGVKVIGAVLNRVHEQLPALLRPYFSEE